MPSRAFEEPPVSANRDAQDQQDQRSFWALLPRRNFRRALFLVLALLGILFIKRTGGGAFRSLLDTVAPPAPPQISRPAARESEFRHIEVRRP
jgi:hypothetical protein